MKILYLFNRIGSNYGYEMKFEWNEKKNLLNIKKHGISFEDAAYAFSDIDAISILDDAHSIDEERWILIGKIKTHGIVIVVHTDRIRGETDFIRIISAREADKLEKQQYINRVGGN
jgi:hypothetical protein